MSILDANADSLRATALNSYAGPSKPSEPGVFSNFLPGAGSYFMRGMAESGRALSMAGAAVPVLADKLIGSDNRGESYGDRYFRWHDEVFGRAVDYWTPKPGEVGAAGQVVGSLAAGLTQFLANPALLIGTAQLSTAEDLVRQGVDAGAANVAGDVAGLSTLAGIALPIFGKTLVGKLTTGAVGNLATNLPEAAIKRAVVESAGSPAAAAQFDPWDVRARTVDVLMGVAFGAKSHFDARGAAKTQAFLEGDIPSQRTAIADAAAQAVESPLTATQRDAIMVMNAARHLDGAALPWRAGEAEHTAAVDNVRLAVDQISAGRAVEVPPLPAEDMLTVWHGSPHKFDAFDAAHIGKGEGAQAYGHGLYLAESEGVARWYHNAMGDWFPNGQKPEPGSVEDAAAAHVATAIDAGYENPYKRAKETVSLQADRVGQAELDVINRWQSEGVEFKRGGATYKVGIPSSMVERMLDWDKPLSQQPEVLKALETHPTMGKESLGWRGAPQGMWERAMSSPSRTGEWLYRELGDKGVDQSAFARQLGIPGIRYLDGGSRGAGQGSYNYVIFPGEEGNLRIHERNGEAVQLAEAIADAAPKSADPVAAPEMPVFAPAAGADAKAEPGSQFADDLRLPTGEFDPATGAPKTISANEYVAKAAADAEHVKATAEGLMRTVATCILGGI